MVQIEVVDKESSKKADKVIIIEIELNGKRKMVEPINKDGYNYIKLREVQDERIQVKYNAVPIIKVKG